MIINKEHYEKEHAFRELVSGLRQSQKRISSKFFYDEQGSILFDEICNLEEYYPTRTEISIMQENIDDIVTRIKPGALFIEYGSGSSIKTRLLLDHLPHIAAYIPIDISLDHLEKTAQDLRTDYPHLKIHPLAADFTKHFELPEIGKEIQDHIVYFPGSTIGNFTKAEIHSFLEETSEICGKGGGLLIGVDLKKDIKILQKAYNDSQGITAAFNKNILTRLNREYGFNFNCDFFKHEATYNEFEGRIEMHLISLREQEIEANGKGFPFKKGESILTEYSHKFTLEEFEDLASDYFWVQKVWTDKEQLFSIQFLVAT